MEEELKKILKDNIYTSFDLNGVELDDVLEEASYFSLFDDKKYMVVKNAQIFGASKRKSKEEDSDDEEKVSKKDEKLLQYLNEPNDNTVLIFTYNGKADTKKKICKIIKDRYKFIQIEDLKPKEIYSRIEKSLKDSGYKLDNSNTGYYIVNNALNNYDLAINEVEKIKLYYGKGCTIKYEDVVNIVSKNIEDNNFKFIDTVISKDIKEAFKIYDDLMIQKVEPIMLMSMLAKEVRNMLLVKKIMKTKSKKDMIEILGLKFDFQIDKLISNSYNFSEEKLEGYLVLLSDLDYKIKRGKISNKLALEMFIMDICR
jgi:DNA polymerase-3 subunit delta